MQIIWLLCYSFFWWYNIGLQCNKQNAQCITEKSWAGNSGFEFNILVCVIFDLIHWGTRIPLKTEDECRCSMTLMFSSCWLSTQHENNDHCQNYTSEVAVSSFVCKKREILYTKNSFLSHHMVSWAFDLSLTTSGCPFRKSFTPLTEKICPICILLVHWVFTTPFSLVTSIAPKLKTMIIYILASIFNICQRIYKEVQVSIVCVLSLRCNFYI